MLVVDATQGVEAQTLANTYLALEHDLELVPILNKIDLPSAHPDEVAQEVEDVIGLPCWTRPPRLCQDRPECGSGAGTGRHRHSRSPPATRTPRLKALIFDSVYDSYKGVIVYIRVFEGHGEARGHGADDGYRRRVHPGGGGAMGATSLTPCAQLQAGEVGYFTASIKTVADTRVGDTVTLANNSPPPKHCPATAASSPWCSAASTPPTVPSTRSEGCTGKTAAERCLPHL